MEREIYAVKLSIGLSLLILVGCVHKVTAQNPILMDQNPTVTGGSGTVDAPAMLAAIPGLASQTSVTPIASTSCSIPNIGQTVYGVSDVNFFWCVPNGGDPSTGLWRQIGGSAVTALQSVSLSSDVTMSAVDSHGMATIILKTITTLGDCGDATHFGVITKNALGLVTACTTYPVPVPGGGGISAVQIAGDGSAPSTSTGNLNFTLNTVNSTVGTFGPCLNITVTPKGLITNISTATCPTSGSGALPTGSGSGPTSLLGTSPYNAPADGALFTATDQPAGQQEFYAVSGAWHQLGQIDTSTTLQYTGGALGASNLLLRLSGGTMLGNLGAQMGVNFSSPNAKPSCDSGHRLWIWGTNNGASADVFEKCVWNGGTFAWVAF